MTAIDSSITAVGNYSPFEFSLLLAGKEIPKQQGEKRSVGINEPI